MSRGEIHVGNEPAMERSTFDNTNDLCQIFRQNISVCQECGQNDTQLPKQISRLVIRDPYLISSLPGVYPDLLFM
jgi:hypothetical protein